MARVYLSYSPQDAEFVHDVADILGARGIEVLIDRDMLIAGGDLQAVLMSKLGAADVFVAFLSRQSLRSAGVLTEIGAARYRSNSDPDFLRFPVALEPIGSPPWFLDGNTVLYASDLSPAEVARRIAEATRELVGGRQPPGDSIQLFISHAHRDVEIARQLVSAIEKGLRVPSGAIRCTSVPGYKLDLGDMAPVELRHELDTANAVVAILTPNSLESEWVLFELGATWVNTTTAIPLLAGGLRDGDIPGPLRGATGGQLDDRSALDKMLQQLKGTLGWPPANEVGARDDLGRLADHVKDLKFEEDEFEADRKATFTARLAGVGSRQKAVLDHVHHHGGDRGLVSQMDLEGAFPKLRDSLYYRLEQLRCLGFLSREKTGEKDGTPLYGWKLSKKYRAELGLD